ncbi:hypothetical protein PsorP6_003481 [Peronosclerospora sorghi]|uniref:Uncharacterized protein n=1 Tax=Peronosclerospora sorghi TaxID=230839 RepID=A0ACC0VNN0_9STRA|nr:hypothetical protein PsorP6_003481 [Peronosclerospora sorghi]
MERQRLKLVACPYRLVVADFELQTNVHDCGVFVCKWMRYMLSGTSLLITEDRETVLKELRSSNGVFQRLPKEGSRADGYSRPLSDV